ncbi:MAG: hypothetical protein IT535_08530 [Bauldia sp.]|nr:hypothetical protein [Bauldia sp.]
MNRLSAALAALILAPGLAVAHEGTGPHVHLGSATWDALPAVILTLFAAFAVRWAGAALRKRTARDRLRRL